MSGSEQKTPFLEEHQAVVDNSKKKKRKKKPARVQVDASVLDEDDRPQQSGSVFNIWYYNWGAKDKYQKKSPYRVDIKNDSGYTKADKITNSYICLFFARGCCHKGKNCEYLHRLPNAAKDSFPMTTDCFGRDKFSDYREDMGGVGNFLRTNKTLYIGKLLIESVPKNTTIEELLSHNFLEFGVIERMRVIYEKNCAFITYENEWNAQFAKEAMAHQSIVNDEVLNLRWANEDPNPQAKARHQRELQQDAINTIKSILGEDKKKTSFKSASNSPQSVSNNDSHVAVQVPSRLPSKRPVVDDNGLNNSKKSKTSQLTDKSGLITGYASSSDEEDS